MPPAEALGLIAIIVTALALAATVIIVVAGIRHEERELSMTRKTAPGPAAALARRVLGLYVKKTDPAPECCAAGERAWHERLG